MHRTRRRPWVILLSAVALCFAYGETARAQQSGVAVQLPTFSYFSVNTSVLVPDSGAGIAAAMRREEANRIMYGPGPSVAQGRAASASGVTVHATIHDPAAESGLVLRNDPAERETQASFARRFNKAAEGSSAGRADLSVAEIKRQRARAGDQDQADALRFFQRGRAAESKGQFGVAAIYYRQAATRASGELRTAAIKQLKVVATAH